MGLAFSRSEQCPVDERRGQWIVASGQLKPVQGHRRIASRTRVYLRLRKQAGFLLAESIQIDNKITQVGEKKNRLQQYTSRFRVDEVPKRVRGLRAKTAFRE